MAAFNPELLQHHILICNGVNCMRRHGEEVTQAIREEIAASGADSRIHTTRTRCNGPCEEGCIVIVYPEGTWYREMMPSQGKEMVRKLAHGGRLEDKVFYRIGSPLAE